MWSATTTSRSTRFTGAGPEYLLGVPDRFPNATVVRLEENYRSTPQVLAFANRLVPKLGGAAKVLRPCVPTGRSRSCGRSPRPSAEGAAIVERIRSLDCALEEVAILGRTNARLTDYEELLHDAGIPFQGSSLLERDAARRLTRRLERSSGDAAATVRDAALEAGWLPRLPDALGERELVRQNDLARLVSLAAGFDGDAAAFVDGAAPAVPPRRRRCPRRPPAHLPPGEGTRVRGRVPAVAP